jgi:hypothetical protein
MRRLSERFEDGSLTKKYAQNNLNELELGLKRRSCVSQRENSDSIQGEVARAYYV